MNSYLHWDEIHINQIYRLRLLTDINTDTPREMLGSIVTVCKKTDCRSCNKPHYNIKENKNEIFNRESFSKINTLVSIDDKILITERER